MWLARDTSDTQSTIAAPRFGRRPVVRHRPIVGRLRRAMTAAGSLLASAFQAFAEARMNRVAIETELYCNRYRHTCKNDDDLPVARRGE